MLGLGAALGRVISANVSERHHTPAHQQSTGLTCPGFLDLEAARDLAMHTAEVLEVAPCLAPAHRKGCGAAAFSAEKAVWN